MAGLGERLARAYLSLWEEVDTRSQMVILTRSALTNELAMARVRPVIADVTSRVSAASLPGAYPEARFSLVMSQLYGVASVRYLTGAPPLRDLTFDDLIAFLAPSIQLLLTEP